MSVAIPRSEAEAQGEIPRAFDQGDTYADKNTFPFGKVSSFNLTQREI